MKRKSGFTMIEVSLVLAIGGMIFLMVFVALPALQRSARDTERREDMMALVNAIKKFQSNNRGSLPSGSGIVNYDAGATSGNTWQGFYSKYLGEDFTDPTSDDNYVLYVTSCGESVSGKECTTNYTDVSFPNDYKITVVTGATCDGEKAEASSNPRKLAVLYKLELGVYCGNT